MTEQTFYEKLNVPQEILNEMISVSPEGIIFSDLLGRTVLFNERALQILGCSSDIDQPTHVDEVYEDPAEAEKIGKLLAKNQGVLRNYPTRLRHSSGESIEVHLSARTLYDPQKKRRGVVGYFEDIRSFQALKKRLLLLARANLTIAQAENWIEGFQSVAKCAVSFLSHSFCRILSLDEEGARLVVRAADVRDQLSIVWEPQIGQRLTYSEVPGLPKISEMREAQELYWHNPEQQAFLQELSAQLKLQPIHSLLRVPLEIRGKTIGLLEIGDILEQDHHPITQEEKGLAFAIAAQAALPLERLHQQALAQRRINLFEKLEEKLHELRPEIGEERLLTRIAHLAPSLVGGTSAGLYTNFRHSQRIRLRCSDGPFFERDGRERGYDDNVAGQVARTKQRTTALITSSNSKEELAVGVPLKQFGEVDYVLVVTYGMGAPEFLEVDLEILQLFADRASLTLSTAQSLKPEQRRRVLDPLFLKLSNYLQSTQDPDKIIHATLTSITAGYGLGFNRAALFLLDPHRKELVGKIGIGHLEDEKARKDWESSTIDKTDDFDGYLQSLEANTLGTTPVGAVIRGLSFSLSLDSDDLFRKAIQTGQPQLASPFRLYTLPESFRREISPSAEFVIVPLKVRNQVLGVIFADKKFLYESIFQDDVELLMIIANIAAIAIDNLRLLRETDSAKQRLQSLYRASSDLLSIQAPRQLLRSIVERLKEVSNADWVRWTMVDDEGQVYDHDVVGIDRKFEMRKLRPDGIAAEVMTSRKAIAVEDTRDQQWKNRLNSLIREEQIGATLCLPITLYEKQIGLMWLNCRASRSFPQSEIDDFQIYVNQAAIAYGRARRHENLEWRRRTTESLAAMSDSQDEVLKQIVETATVAFDANSAVVWIYDSYRKKFHLADPQAKEINEASLRKIQELGPHWHQGASRILDEGWVGIEDVDAPEHLEFWPLEVREWIKQVGEKSFQGIALTIGEEKLGILFLNYNQPCRFSKEDEELARAFGNHAALALKKVQLLEQVRKAKQSLEVVARVMALGEHDETLNSITQKTLEAIRCDAVTLYTYDQDTDTIHYPPKMAGVWNEDGVEQLDNEPKGSMIWQMLKKDAPQVVEIASDPLFKDTRFANEEHIQSCVVVPLKVAKRETGVMFVNYRHQRRFREDELANIQHFANQAAVAIYNAQLYDQAQRRAEALEALHHAGQEITGSLDSQEILRRIGQQAWNLVGRSSRQAAVTSDVWLVEDGIVKLVAAWPNSSHDLLPREINLTPKIPEKIGVVGRTARTGVLQSVPDVSKDDDYLPCRKNVQSELAVPIIVEGKVVAVINVEHSQLSAFLPEYVHALELLAVQAGIAIQNARQYEELEKTRDQLAAKTAVAWMGIASATWRHATRTDATTIRDTADLLRLDLENKATEEKIRSRINSIKRLAKKIQNAPITAPLSAHEGTQIIPINDLLRDRLNQLRKNQSMVEMHKGVSFRYLSSSATSYFVRGNPYWFAQAFDLLVDNAVKAMVASTPKEIVVMTQSSRGGVKISLADTGKGIPPKVRQLLLHGPIPEKLHPNGSGMGLLLAQTIFQAYGGDLHPESTSPTGTTMTIWLPLSKQESEGRTIRTPGGVLFVSGSEEKPENVSLLDEALAPLGGIQVVPEEKALERILQEDHEIVLLDGPSMADLSTLIQQIHERQPTIKIIVLASAPDWRAAREFLRLGATDYIDKSTNFDELKAIFARLFKNLGEASILTSARPIALEEESDTELGGLYA